LHITPPVARVKIQLGQPWRRNFCFCEHSFCFETTLPLAGFGEVSPIQVSER
jgi:hypothetical protein